MTVPARSIRKRRLAQAMDAPLPHRSQTGDSPTFNNVTTAPPSERRPPFSVDPRTVPLSGTVGTIGRAEGAWVQAPPPPYRVQRSKRH